MTGLPVALQRSHVRHVLAQERATLTTMRHRATALQSRMKQDHPWSNVSGDAEKSLGATVDNPVINGFQTAFTMRVGYINNPKVPYGIWLELARAGRFSVVKSAVQREGPALGVAVKQARRGL